MLKIFRQSANELFWGKSDFPEHALGKVACATEHSSRLVGIMAMICNCGFVFKFYSANCAFMLLMLKQAVYKFASESGSMLSKLGKFVCPFFRVVSYPFISGLVVTRLFGLFVSFLSGLNAMRLTVIRASSFFYFRPRVVLAKSGFLFFYKGGPSFTVIQKIRLPLFSRAFVLFLVCYLWNHATRHSFIKQFA